MTYCLVHQCFVPICNVIWGLFFKIHDTNNAVSVCLVHEILIVGS